MVKGKPELSVNCSPESDLATIALGLALALLGDPVPGPLLAPLTEARIQRTHHGTYLWMPWNYIMTGLFLFPQFPDKDVEAREWPLSLMLKKSIKK